MKVVCIEGCHGCGKTEIVKALAERGQRVLDEGFLDMPKFSLPPQSFVMETLWVAKWIERVLKLQKEYGNKAVFFADRSPFSAMFYAPNGKILEPVISEAIEDLLANAGIEVIIMYVKTRDDLLWQRIQNRLQREPERVKYREDKRDWMEETVTFYESSQRLWDYEVTNNTEDINSTVDTILRLV